MSGFGADLGGAAFQAISFLCLMAIPWTNGKGRVAVIVVAVFGIASILGFQFFIGISVSDFDLGRDLMIVTLTNAVIYFAGSWTVERIFRLFLLSRKKNRQPPS
ncbi:hypothetical protein [Sneathiella sp.]|uniref:hypothetical protein n=1 Tax=Sneathiella sp. TaxID=1964365 RepID=UPI00356AED5C